MTLIPERIRDYDVLVLSEVFDDSVRALLLQGLRADYPHHTLVAGSDGVFKQDGGVMILSKWPIQAKDRLEFRVQNLRRFDPDTMCHGSDCLAEKGVVYARIAKEERTYHVFGTHLQAGSGGVEAAVRVRQLLVIQSWIDAKAIPPTDMVIIAGDLNIDRGTNEHGSMLQILRATNPPTGGHPYTVDPEINELSGSDRRAFLDYVLFSRRHLQPSSASLEVRPIRAPRGWGIDDDEWDLSDHFPVYGRFRFGRPAFTVSPPLLRFERVPADTTVVHDEGLTVTSVGSGPVTLRGVQLRGGAAAALFQVTASPPTPFPVTLQPGQRFPVAVAFRGQAEGRRQAEVAVTGDDLLGAPVTATAVLVAEVVVPDMAVLPTSINFGPVRVGQEMVRNVLVTNNGSAPLRYRVEPPSQPRFQWPAETAVGRSLPPGDAAVVAVRYVPDAPGAHSAVLTVVGDDETVRVALSGQGVPP